MVRTPGSHPGNRGSIPLGTTKELAKKTIFCYHNLRCLNEDFCAYSSVGRAAPF